MVHTGLDQDADLWELESPGKVRQHSSAPTEDPADTHSFPGRGRGLQNFGMLWEFSRESGSASHKCRVVEHEPAYGELTDPG